MADTSRALISTFAFLLGLLFVRRSLQTNPASPHALSIHRYRSHPHQDIGDTSELEEYDSADGDTPVTFLRVVGYMNREKPPRAMETLLLPNN